MRIGIVGAGFAGLEAAGAASEAGAEVVLFGRENALPYFRPRLIALAFGQAEPSAMSIRPANWYATRKIDLRQDAEVAAIDTATPTAIGRGWEEKFDALVLCAGADPIAPPPSATAGLAVYPLWNLSHAHTLRGRVRAGEELAIIGGGILGIEAALRATDAGMRVTVIEKAERLMPAQFGTRASRTLQARLATKGIQVLAGRTATAFSAADKDKVILTLDNGTAVGPCICLISIGARPLLTLAAAGGLKTDRGVLVSETLQTSAPRVYAAGDVTQLAGSTRCSVKEAMAQGRVAGANVVAALQGKPLRPYVPQTLPLTFKSGDFELYAVGPPGGEGYEEHLLEGSSDDVLRTLVQKNGQLCGVQMIGTRRGFDDYFGQLEG